MSKTYEFSRCSDPKEGAFIYQGPTQILRTILPMDDPDQHNDVAKRVVNALNNEEKAEFEKNNNPSASRSSAPKSSASSAQIGDRFDWLDKIIKDVLSLTDLSDFEDSFSNSMADRLGKYGTKTYVSSRQMDVILDLETRAKDAS